MHGSKATRLDLRPVRGQSQTSSPLVHRPDDGAVKELRTRCLRPFSSALEQRLQPLERPLQLALGDRGAEHRAGGEPAEDPAGRAELERVDEVGARLDGREAVLGDSGRACRAVAGPDHPPRAHSERPAPPGDARRAMGAAREAALAANERAAREIEALIDSLPAAPAAPVPPAAGGLYTSAAGLARPLPAPALPPPPTASQWEQMGEDLAWLWGKLTTPSPDERWLTDRVGDWVFSREDPTKEQRDAQREQGQPVTAPKTLPGYPDAERVRKKGGRTRWEEGTGRKKKILEWDGQHGRVEVYDRKGKHLGEFDPDTREPTKDKDPSRGPIEP